MILGGLVNPGEHSLASGSPGSVKADDISETNRTDKLLSNVVYSCTQQHNQNATQSSQITGSSTGGIAPLGVI